MAQRLLQAQNPSKIEPALYPDDARTIAVALAASISQTARGTILAQNSTSGLYNAYASAVLAAPTTALTLTPTGSDGTLPTGVYQVAYTLVDAAGNETTINTPASVTVGSTNHIAITAITPLPAGAASANIYITDPAGGIFHQVFSGWTGAAHSITAPVYGGQREPIYNKAVSGVAIAMFDFSTDASGNVFIGQNVNETGIYSDAKPTLQCYHRGYFNISDLQAGAAAILQGLIPGVRFISSGSTQIVLIP